MFAPRWTYKSHFSLLQWLGLLASLTIISALIVCWQISSTYRSFLQQSGLSGDQLWSLIRQAALTSTLNQDGQTSLLLLGTDELETRPGNWPLTDTMMLIKAQPEFSNITLLSLPRDLVLPGDKNRINAIYPIFYQESTQTAGLATAQYLSSRLDIPIHYQVVVTMRDVADFIDLVGGVDVEIARSFIDYQYPRDDVDVTTVRDPQLLYETVEFTAGPAHLDGPTALKFMRSRHAQNEEGSDFARATRQRQVIEALASKLGARFRDDLRRYDLRLLGECYQFYNDRFADQLPFTHALALALDFLSRERLPQVSSGRLSVDEPGSVLHENKRDFTIQADSLEALRAAVRRELKWGSGE